MPLEEADIIKESDKEWPERWGRNHSRARHQAHIVYKSSHVILTTALWFRHYYYFCFTDEEIESYNLNVLPKFPRKREVELELKPETKADSTLCIRMSQKAVGFKSLS